MHSNHALDFTADSFLGQSSPHFCGVLLTRRPSSHFEPCLISVQYTVAHFLHLFTGELVIS